MNSNASPRSVEDRIAAARAAATAAAEQVEAAARALQERGPQTYETYEAESGMRLDMMLVGRLPPDVGKTRERVESVIRGGYVFVNGAICEDPAKRLAR